LNNWNLKLQAKFIIPVEIELAIVNFTNIDGLLVGEFRKNAKLIFNEYSNEVQISFSIKNIAFKNGEYYFDFALYTVGRKQSPIHVSMAGPIVVERKILTDAVCALYGSLNIIK
jgi:hypothetical protein